LRTLVPSHEQKGIYSLTESSIQLVSLLAHLGLGTEARFSFELFVDSAQPLEQDGERMGKVFMTELRGRSRGACAAVSAELQAAYETAISCRREESLMVGKVSSKKEGVTKRQG
jgi:hypothetical protein